MWNLYRPKIMFWQFFPYVTYLICFFILTSVVEVNPLEGMKLIDKVGMVLQEERDSDLFNSKVTIRIFLSAYPCLIIGGLLFIELQ